MISFKCREGIKKIGFLMLLAFVMIGLANVQAYADRPEVRTEIISNQEIDIEDHQISVLKNKETTEYDSKFKTKNNIDTLSENEQNKEFKNNEYLSKIRNSYDRTKLKLHRIDTTKRLRNSLPSIETINKASKGQKDRGLEAARKEHKENNSKTTHNQEVAINEIVPCSRDAKKRYEAKEIANTTSTAEKSNGLEVKKKAKDSKVRKIGAIEKVKKLTKRNETVF